MRNRRSLPRPIAPSVRSWTGSSSTAIVLCVWLASTNHRRQKTVSSTPPVPILPLVTGRANNREQMSLRPPVNALTCDRPGYLSSMGTRSPSLCIGNPRFLPLPPATAMQTESLSDYERERGKPMPSKAHGYTQSNLIIALAEFRDATQSFRSSHLSSTGARGRRTCPCIPRRTSTSSTTRCG